MTSIDPRLGQPEFTQCDREVIHLYPRIQGHGILLAFRQQDRRIQMISENAPKTLGIEPREVLGAKLDHIFQTAFIDRVTQLIESYPWASFARHIPIRPVVGERSYDGFLYQTDGLFVIELEPFKVEDQIRENEVEIEQTLREYMIKSKLQKSTADLAKLACFTIRKLTGLDRVMMYRFLPPVWHGEVIAEDRVTHAHSFLGHRFPASDIPLPARQLYLRNMVRLIPNVQAPTVDLVPKLNPGSKKPLDLRDSRLRAVAPVHLEYLKNMKVEASFSVAITDHDQLWGLIACHHLKPMMITQSLRTACEIIAHAFSVQAPLLEQNIEQGERLDFNTRIRKVLEPLRNSQNPMGDFFKQHRSVTEAFGADGIAVVGEKLEDFAGVTPLRADLEELAKVLKERLRGERSGYLAIDCLTEMDPQWVRIKDYCSGVLATFHTEPTEKLVLIFRPELLSTITWGGNPNKNMLRRDFQGQINPRASFESWQETVRERSRPWRKFEIDGILFLRDFLLDGFVRKERLIEQLNMELRRN